MNLGNANLKSVNSSRPQLLHSLSKQSIAASDDYYSFSEHASEGSSLGSQITVVRYQTPPSHARSLAPSPDKSQPQAKLLSQLEKPHLARTPVTPLIVRFDENQAKEKRPGRSPNATVEKIMEDDLSLSTPGVDDTPYIRFAIDQLTRDEELTGRRRGGSGDSEASYPVERIIPDEGLGYYKQPGKPPPQEGQPSGLLMEGPRSPKEENFFIPRQPLVGGCFLIFWISTFTIPLQASAFQTRLVGLDRQDTWRWTAVQPVAWTLVALYALLAIALLTILSYFNKRRTGLMWDATSLADLLVLTQRSNILHGFDGSETSQELRPKKSSSSYRLGYWRMSNEPHDIFYAIGQENEPMRRFSLRQGKLEEKASRLAFQDPTGFDIEGQRPLKSATVGSFQTNIHSPAVRYRWTPWFLQDTFLVAWIATAMVLLLAFIVVSFVRHAVRDGFSPLLASSTNSFGFSPADFLYSFIPSLFGLTLFLLWQPIDMYFRALQPFSNLANPRGTSVEEGVLLNYTSCFPLAVTVKAAAAGHYKVAWFSFISLLSVTLPILGGGVFTAQYFTSKQEVRIAACMPAFYALLVFVILYAISIFFIWPTRTRHLPHDIRTLADLISFVYQSPMLNDAAFQGPKSKTDLVTRLLSPPPGEKTQPRYAFGVFRGRDGKEHLGIDRLQRPGSGEMLVTTGTMS
ncbi:MAG: hypothetical protein M1830_003926 [Pleopsidium flavum]|nr:MAG: hypothetical protein M1830_003926 [Pleopsidium flavum]